MKIIKVVQLFGLLSIIIFTLGSIFFSQIESSIFTFIQAYGAAALIFVVFFAEATPQPIGPEIAFVAGKFAGLQNTGILAVTLIASAAATMLNYYIGYMFYDDVCNDKKCRHYASVFSKYGKYALVAAAVLPIPYVPFGWISGASGYDLKYYFYYMIVPRLLRIVTVAFFFRNYLSLIF